MSDRKAPEPSEESIARANRKRLAFEDGARAMVEAEQRAQAVRKNMDRLRALREAREAAEPPAAESPPAKKKKRVKAPAREPGGA